jgi:iron complex outermembrane receptor protein
MQLRFPFSRLTLALIAAYAAAPLHAQDTTTSGDLTAPTVEVSASADASAAGLEPEYAGGQVATGGRVGMFGNVDFMDAPFNSMNYTNELIKDQQARTVGDVLLNDPSVRVTRGFGNFQETYMIRGFPLTSDDMMYNGLYGILPRQFVAAELIERVEVMRGANSFMNGATPTIAAAGGAINLVPKRAGNDPLSQVTLGYESNGQGYVGTDISRRFGPDGSSGLRLNAAVRNGDTAVDDEHNNLGVFALGFDHRGDGWRVSADIGYQDVKLEQPRPSVNVAAGVPVPGAPDSSSNWAQPWTYSSERDTFGTLRGEIDLTENVVTWAALGMRQGSEDNALAGVTVTNTAGDAAIQGFDNTREDSIVTGEVGIRGKFRTGSIGHTLAANVSAYSAEIKNAYACCSPLPGTNIYHPVDVTRVPNTAFTGGNLDDPLKQHTTDLLSVAVADTLAFIDDRLLVSVGVRHQQIKDKTFNYNTGALDPNGSYDEEAFTPLLGVVYKIVPSVSVYGNYVESLTKGPVASGFPPPSNVGQAFAPTKVKQTEIGAKYDSGSLGATVALFSTDLPLSIVENNVFSVDGEQRNRGVELTAFGEPVRGVRVLGGVTFLDAEQTRTSNGVNQGKKAIGVPDTQLNVGGEWDLPWVERLTVTGRVLYTSTQYLDGGNTQELPSWTRLDLGARYLVDMGSQLLTLRAAVENVTDENYWASAGGYPGAGYLVMGSPRTFVVNASLDF